MRKPKEEIFLESIDDFNKFRKEYDYNNKQNLIFEFDFTSYLLFVYYDEINE